MLLEEAILYFLGTALYRRVTSGTGDPTLWRDPTGLLHVVGRGELHQIDAIADFIIKPPFSPVQRLLVEAKFHRTDASGRAKATGLDIIRNAVGVLKDVGENWHVPRAILIAAKERPGRPRRPVQRSRYHYQYAVISSSGFTLPAQNYAFAQDISLIQVGHSRYFRPVIDAIDRLTGGHFNAADVNHLPVNLSSLRSTVRQRLHAPDKQPSAPLPMPGPAALIVERFIAACRAIKLGVLVAPGSGPPVLLVANPGAMDVIGQVLDDTTPPGNAEGGQSRWRLRRDPETGGWIVDYAGADLFSFDIPPRFFRLLVEHQRPLDDNQQSEDLTIRVAFADTENRLGRVPRAGFSILTFDVSWSDVERFLAELEEGESGEEDRPGG